MYHYQQKPGRKIQKISLNTSGHNVYLRLSRTDSVSLSSPIDSRPVALPRLKSQGAWIEGGRSHRAKSGISEVLCNPRRVPTQHRAIPRRVYASQPAGGGVYAHAELLV
ncbi:hypothetical protein PGTUg99_012122 [Puccinia graminis f. sp. tritici]|uniref:Uncharacterized protein n=1 Tax=Puccinia graminis f. sp. tritici TaxID=56615 RepID=A0A5B0RY40_PUCGR|nr:hypothetical protein PGTUg99_012122 [Puccinia graminis f. sp. tritici]